MQMQPSDVARANGGRTKNRSLRTVEDQAELDAEVTAALTRAEEAASARLQQSAEFLRPRFSPRQITAALGLKVDAFDNWRRRGEIPLDGGEKPDLGGKRLYSARDAIRIGIASRLNDVGVIAPRLRKVLEGIEAVFPLTTTNPMLTGSRAVSIMVLGSDEVVGPEYGEAFDTSIVPAGSAVIVLRLDEAVRAALEPLGYAVTHGSAEDHRQIADRLTTDAADGATGKP